MIGDDTEDDGDDHSLSLQNEFNPFDPVWGTLYRSHLDYPANEDVTCLEKIGTFAALQFASDNLKSIGIERFIYQFSFQMTFFFKASSAMMNAHRHQLL